MNPTVIRLRNFGTYEDLDLHLPAGVVGVTGVNGAGKSTLLNAIDVALFGSTIGRTLEPYLSKGGGDTVSVELEFEHAGETYRVRRSYSASGRGKSSLDFEREGPGWHAEPDEHGDPVQVQSQPEWEPLTQGNATETQSLIETTIGLTRDTFRASAFLAQSDGAAFTEAEPKNRKRILAEVLGLDAWEAAKESVSVDRKAADLARDAAQVKADTLAEVVAQREAVAENVMHLERIHTAAERNVAAAQEQAALALNRVREYETLEQQRAAHGAAVRAATSRATDHDRIGLAAETAVAELGEVNARREKLADRGALQGLEAHRTRIQTEREALASAISAHRIAESERAALVNQSTALERQAGEAWIAWETLRDQADELAVPDEHAKECDRCGQAMGADARARAAASYRQDADVKKAESDRLRAEAAAIVIPDVPAAPDHARMADLDAQGQELQRQIGISRAEVEEGAALMERTKQLLETVGLRNAEWKAENERLHAEAADAQARLDALPSADGLDAAAGEHAWARAEADRLAKEQADRADIISRAKGRLQEIDAAAGAQADAVATRDAASAEAATLLTLEKAFGRDGVPAWIVEQRAIPQIEAEATRLLADLGGPVSRVELRTERALKGGGTSDELDIVCVTEQGERDYSTFSGGEKTRVNLALRISLARLLAHRRGAESRVLCIDEPEHLDEPGTAALIGVLRSERVAADFDRVLLVSHVPALRDAPFESVLAVTNVGGRSEVETA